MIRLLEQTGGKLIAMKTTEKLTSDDFEKIMPIIGERAVEYVKLKWYFEMENTENWNPKSFWEEVKFTYGQSNVFEKIALVGKEDREEWLKSLMRAFMPEEIKFFDLSQKKEAMEWING